MSATVDMSQYLDLFLQEAEEQLEILEQETLKLEADPNQERLQAIFRAAHTIKGSSRAMGFARFAELTHEMENVLDMLRSDRLQVSTPCADALLAAIDTLVQMKDSIAAGQGDAAVDAGSLADDLRALGREAAGGESADAAAAQADASGTGIDPAIWAALAQAAAERPVFHAKVRLAADCVMKFVRAYMAISMVQEEGELLATCPSSEALEDEQFDREFELVFHSGHELAALQARLAEISEVESAWAGPWVEPASEDLAAAAMGAAAEDAEAVVRSPGDAIEEQAAAKAGRRADASQTVRVDVARLDSLMNLVGELVIDRTRLTQIGGEISMQSSGPAVDALNETVGHIARITNDLQDQIMKARMMPIEVVFNRFPRVVRDLANKLGKDVKLELVGGDTELDRSVIEIIGDPILHLLRNAVDHGLEGPEQRLQAGKSGQGTLTLKAMHHENHIVIEIRDDGKGIDPERIKAKAVATGAVSAEHASRMTDKEAIHLIFGSGFSTAAEVSEVSGRGVGMDIVRSNLQRLGGLIDVESQIGKGTTFTLRLPLTLAIIRGLLVSVNGSVYVLPLGSVVETLLLKDEEVQQINKREVIVLRGQTTPLVRLAQVFRVYKEASRSESGSSFAVIVGMADQRVGLVVDELIGEQEVVIKSLSRFVGDVRGISGATILGNGHVALIVDVNSVLMMERS